MESILPVISSLLLTATVAGVSWLAARRLGVTQIQREARTQEGYLMSALKDRVEFLEGEVKRLESENSELRQENERLERRVLRLERLVSDRELREHAER